MAEPVGPQFEHPRAPEPPSAARGEAGSAKTPPPDAPPASGSVAPFEAVANLWSQVADVDPITYYWEEPSEARRRSIKESQEDSSSFLPSRRVIYKRSEPSSRPEDELANVIAFLQNLRVSVRRPEPQAEGSAPESGQSVLQAKRLTRTGVTPDHFQIGAPPKAWSAPRIEAAPAPEAAEKPAPQKPAPLPKVPPTPKPVLPKRLHAAWPILTGTLLLTTLGLAASLWTRAGSGPRADVAPAGKRPARTSEIHPSEAALNLTNLALEAIQQGDLEKASRLLDDARKQGSGLPGFSYQAALLALDQGRSEEASDLLDRSIRANEAVAECWYLCANVSFSAAGPAQAAEAFQQAVYADPFSPRYYFFRAECLRRNGNTAAALAQFQQALQCRPNSADTELILFKIGLARLEGSSDLIFRTELHDHLSHEPVAGDTLLLAAADAVGRSEYAEAAGDLKRAALVLPPRVFQSRVRDYVFRAQAQQPDIAPVLKAASSADEPGLPAPRTARVVVDPATRSLAEADPAGW